MPILLVKENRPVSIDALVGLRRGSSIDSMQTLISAVTLSSMFFVSIETLRRGPRATGDTGGTLSSSAASVAIPLDDGLGTPEKHEVHHPTPEPLLTRDWRNSLCRNIKPAAQRVARTRKARARTFNHCLVK